MNSTIADSGKLFINFEFIFVNQSSLQIAKEIVALKFGSLDGTTNSKTV